MVRELITRPVDRELRLRMSYEEYLEQIDESAHAEWVDGEVTVFMPPERTHQRIVKFLVLLLDDFIEEFELGEMLPAPFEMKLRAGRSYREPDLLFVRTEHLERMDEKRLVGPADLAIEIVSEESIERDRREKRQEYEAAGIPEYWVIDPLGEEISVTMLALNAGGVYEAIEPDSGGRLHSRVLPGFWIEPAWFAAFPFPRRAALLHEMAPARFPAPPPREER